MEMSGGGGCWSNMNTRKLSNQEKLIFDYLNERSPRIISRLEIYKEIISDYCPNENAAINNVNVVIWAIRKKLGTDSIVTVQGRGVYIKNGLNICPCCGQEI